MVKPCARKSRNATTRARARGERLVSLHKWTEKLNAGGKSMTVVRRGSGFLSTRTPTQKRSGDNEREPRVKRDDWFSPRGGGHCAILSGELFRNIYMAFARLESVYFAIWNMSQWARTMEAWRPSARALEWFRVCRFIRFLMGGYLKLPENYCFLSGAAAAFRDKKYILQWSEKNVIT